MDQRELPASEKPRDSNERFVRTPEQMEKDHEAAMLRTRSWTYKTIGEHFGVSQAAAHRMVQRAIAEIPREKTEELLASELAKVEMVERKFLEIIERHHAHISASGKVVYDAEGRQIIDDGPVIQALAGYLKAGERRAKLLGLNAPVKHEVITLDYLDAEIQRLEREVGESTRAEA